MLPTRFDRSEENHPPINELAANDHVQNNPLIVAQIPFDTFRLIIEEFETALINNQNQIKNNANNNTGDKEKNLYHAKKIWQDNDLLRAWVYGDSIKFINQQNQSDVRTISDKKLINLLKIAMGGEAKYILTEFMRSIKLKDAIKKLDEERLVLLIEKGFKVHHSGKGTFINKFIEVVDNIKALTIVLNKYYKEVKRGSLAIKNRISLLENRLNTLQRHPNAPKPADYSLTSQPTKKRKAVSQERTQKKKPKTEQSDNIPQSSIFNAANATIFSVDPTQLLASYALQKKELASKKQVTPQPNAFNTVRVPPTIQFNQPFASDDNQENCFEPAKDIVVYLDNNKEIDLDLELFLPLECNTTTSSDDFSASAYNPRHSPTQFGHSFNIQNQWPSFSSRIEKSIEKSNEPDNDSNKNEYARHFGKAL